MAFQVRIRINKNRIDELSVASSREEFEKFTIRDLKRKALSLFPKVDGRLKLSSAFTFHEFEIENVHFIELICLFFLSDVKPDVNHLIVLLYGNELEDHQTFKSCNIEHLSLLIIVQKCLGGGGMTVSLFVFLSLISVLIRKE